jgi:hypothetical protein
MFKQGKKILLGAGVLAALSFGGSALAAAGAAPVAPIVQQSSGADQDEVQSGDQTTPDSGAGASGTEAGMQESSGSEVPGNDGPGGHADEPGNPNADHQASGQSEE